MTSCFPFLPLLFADSDNSKNEPVYIGQVTSNSSDVEFVVLSVTDTQTIGYNETENNFIIVTVKISNNGSESWSQSPLSCYLHKDDAKYSYSSATYSLENSMSSMYEINPGITKTMSIAFETPTKSTEDTYSITLSDHSGSSGKTVTIILKNPE